MGYSVYEELHKNKHLCIVQMENPYPFTRIKADQKRIKRMIKHQREHIQPLSSCLFRLSLGTKVPSAFAITSDLVFAYCILYTYDKKFITFLWCTPIMLMYNKTGTWGKIIKNLHKRSAEFYQ